MQQSNFQPENLGGPKIPDNLGGPKIPTNPLDFGTVQRGSSKPLQETLTNENSALLLWNVSITYGSGWAGWLSLNLSSGTIPANGNQDLSVTANTSALAPGTYAATLTFSGNFSPNEQVAVNLVVQ
jgi:Viral BACON domain